MPADRLPNFFLVGAAKAGTSSLHAYLDQHPQIFMSTSLEVGPTGSVASTDGRGVGWEHREAG